MQIQRGRPLPTSTRLERTFGLVTLGIDGRTGGHPRDLPLGATGVI